MPELTPQSTTPPVPPSETPPADPPPAVPPIIDPATWEDFPILRETFMVYLTDPTANAALRSAGGLLYDLILEYWRYWPNHPEGLLRGHLRAAVADLRHLQGFLAEWDGPEVDHKSPHEEHLGKIAGEVARELAELADRLETEMGAWRGEV